MLRGSPVAVDKSSKPVDFYEENPIKHDPLWASVEAGPTCIFTWSIYRFCRFKYFDQSNASFFQKSLMETTEIMWFFPGPCVYKVMKTDNFVNKCAQILSITKKIYFRNFFKTQFCLLHRQKWLVSWDRRKMLKKCRTLCPDFEALQNLRQSRKAGLVPLVPWSRTSCEWLDLREGGLTERLGYLKIPNQSHNP